MKILCQTLFDCSFTGVTGNFRSSALPFRDRTGQLIDNVQDWNRSRNQQRNYETLLQIFGLRTQPMNISQPVKNGNRWEFSFETETESVFGLPGVEDPLHSLKLDCEGVPMVQTLEATALNTSVLSAAGTQQNIWFQVINTPTEN
jgi:hypothetical protein